MGVRLTPQPTEARGRAVLTYGRECVAGSRGLQGEGASRKAHLRSTDGQRADSNRGGMSAVVLWSGDRGWRGAKA
jgi:hypothetical protein